MELIRIKKNYTGKDGKPRYCWNFYLRLDNGLSCPVRAVTFGQDYTNNKILFAMSTESIENKPDNAE